MLQATSFSHVCQRGALRAPKEKVEGGADLHCPNLTLWFRAALAVDSGRLRSKEVGLYFLGEVSAHTQGCEDPSWDLALKSLHLKCLVVS